MSSLIRRNVGLALLVLVLLSLEPRPVASRDAAGAAPVATSVQTRAMGRGWFSALVCAGCLGVGVGAVLTGGLGAVLAFAAAEGSTLAVGACVGACIEALR